MTSPSHSADAVPDLGLAERWRRGRCHALRTVVPDAPAEASEDELLALAWALDPTSTLRRVFDNSRILGIGFRRYHRAGDLTLRDLSELFPTLGAPCHPAGFERVEGESAWRSTRAPCASRNTPGLCDYWRESIQGLASGLSSTACYTRVESPAHGGQACVDLLHLDPASPLRFTPPRAEDQAALEAVGELVRHIDSGASLHVLGVSEGALHYRLESSKRGCGFDIHTVFERAVQRRLPNLTVCNASPRAVLTDTN